MSKAYFTCYILLSLTFFSCTRETKPSEVVKAWLIHKSKGECKQAFNLEVDDHYRHFDEYECEAYQLDIQAVNCMIEGEWAVCGCYESRESSSLQQFYYNLKKVDGVWKVSP